MNDDIENLVNRIKKRDSNALETIMDLFLSSVSGLAKSILGTVCTKEDIEECIEDVFIDAWNNISEFNPDKGSFKTWLLIICKYKALNLRKATIKKNNLVDIENIQCTSKENIEELILLKESRQLLLNLINSFAAIDKAIFIRKYFLHQDIQQICTVMELSRQSVDNRLWRGRKKLKEALDLADKGEYKCLTKKTIYTNS